MERNCLSLCLRVPISVPISGFCLCKTEQERERECVSAIVCVWAGKIHGYEYI